MSAPRARPSPRRKLLQHLRTEGRDASAALRALEASPLHEYVQVWSPAEAEALVALQSKHPTDPNLVARTLAAEAAADAASDDAEARATSEAASLARTRARVVAHFNRFPLQDPTASDDEEDESGAAPHNRPRGDPKSERVLPDRAAKRARMDTEALCGLGNGDAPRSFSRQTAGAGASSAGGGVSLAEQEREAARFLQRARALMPAAAFASMLESLHKFNREELATAPLVERTRELLESSAPSFSSKACLLTGVRCFVPTELED